MKFRKYTKEDATSVNDIFAQHWTDSEFIEELNEELMKADFWVAEDTGEVIAVAGVRPSPPHLGSETSLELYIIAAKQQGMGVGSQLLEYVETHIPDEYDELVLYSPETHKNSWRFYERNGFERGGSIVDPDDGHPGMLWRKMV